MLCLWREPKPRRLHLAGYTLFLSSGVLEIRLEQFRLIRVLGSDSRDICGPGFEISAL